MFWISRSSLEERSSSMSDWTTVQPSQREIVGKRLLKNLVSTPVTVSIKATRLPANAVLGWHVSNRETFSDTHQGLAMPAAWVKLRTDGNGNGESTFHDDKFQRGKGTYILSRAVVIHALQDQRIGATGNTGGRAAIGVIGYRNVSAPIPSLFSLVGKSTIGTTTTGATTSCKLSWHLFCLESFSSDKARG
ncbi:hypothetical protein BJ742DRAFT_872010 [Cladochytrium replicatum]|nr:hypothetical protein BJ742DRAFT_872010 [Cladochytrium replicatum]